MSADGYWVRRAADRHRCEPPIEPGIAIGDLWRCRCRQLWRARHGGFGMVWQRPPWRTRVGVWVMEAWQPIIEALR